MRARSLSLITALLALLLPGTAAAPASLGGRVVAGATRQPVRGAVVSLLASGTRSGVVTGADGSFLLTGLAAGNWRLIATKSGYFEGALGRRRPGAEDEKIDIADGASLSRIEILMWPEAMISGAVVDEVGEPVAGVRVQAMPTGGDWTAGTQLFGLTDATGRYAIGKLKPGNYVVGTTLYYVFDPDVALPGLTGPGHVTVSGALVPPFVMAGATRQIYTGALFPDAESTSTASVVALSSGEDRTAVDLRLPLRASVRVSGRLTNMIAAIAEPALVVLSNDAVRLVATASADGSFSLGSVPPGQYVVDIATGKTSARATTSVVVGGQDLSDVSVTIPRDATVSGVILSSGQVPSAVSISLTAVGTSKLFAAQASDGRFAIKGVPPGRYVLRFENGGGWIPESVNVSGRDITDTLLDVDGDFDGLMIRATSQPAIVTGKVRLPDGAIAHGATVVVFPSDPGQWKDPVASPAVHFRRDRVTGGDYVIGPVPAGEYVIAAVDDALLENWPQRDLLSRLAASAERLRLAGGDKLVRDLVLRDR
jgi:hypothetical protein